MINKSYRKYNDIRNKLRKFSYENIKIDVLSSYFIAEIVYLFPTKSLIKKIKFIVKRLFLIPKIKCTVSSEQSLFGRSIHRADYIKLSEAYKSELNWDFDEINFCEKNAVYKFGVNFKAFKLALNIAIKIKGSKLSERLMIFFAVYYPLSFYMYLDSNCNNLNPNNYVSFNSSFYHESVFTIFMRKKGIMTWSLQHGMYFDYKNEVPFEMITSYFCTAEKMLMWGEFSKKEVGNYLTEAKELVIFGNPLYRVDKEEKMSFCSLSMNVLVGLPRQLYEAEIIKILTLLSDPALLNFSFIIRPHPTNDNRLINRFIRNNVNFKLTENTTLIKDLISKKYKAMIGFNSTVLFESLANGLPIGQFISGNDEFFDVGFYEFSTSNQLCQFLHDQSHFKTTLDANYYMFDSI
jgi:hypothetical protein